MQNNEELVLEKKAIKRDNNPFTLKGTLSRGGLLITLLFIFFLILIFFGLAYVIYKYSQDLIIAGYIVKALQIICTIISLYLILIAYIKRLYDIINNKRKSIFYGVSFFIAQNAIANIHFLKFLTPIIGFLVLFALLFIPGQKNQSNA